MPFYTSQFPTYKRKVWLYHQADFDKLNSLIVETDWNFITLNSEKEACELFTENFFLYIHECIPRKEVTIRPNDKPWYDSQIRTVSTKRDGQRKRANKSKTKKIG